MAVQKQDGLFTNVGLSAADLTGKEFLFCKLNTDKTVSLAGSGEAVAGVISEGKIAGKHTSFNTKGNPQLKVISGGAIAVNAAVQSGANGVAISGGTNAWGKALSASGGAGEVVTIEPY